MSDILVQDLLTSTCRPEASILKKKNAMTINSRPVLKMSWEDVKRTTREADSDDDIREVDGD